MDNKLLLKVHGGTRPSGKRLCDSCTNGVVMTGRADSKEVIYCHEIGEFLPLEVTACNSYKDKSLPSLSDMKSIAWQLRTEKNGRSIGFVGPKEWRRLERNGDEDYLDDLD